MEGYLGKRIQPPHARTSKAMSEAETGRTFNHVDEYGERLCLRSPSLSPLILSMRYARNMTINEKSNAFHIYKKYTGQ
jgi:hypothetical protein